MNKKIMVLCLLFVAISCYEYTTTNQQQTVPIDIQIPTYTSKRFDTLRTERQSTRAMITSANPSLSNAVATSIRVYLTQRGITGDYRLSRNTLYGIVNSIPKQRFAGRNRDNVRIGEIFSFRLPRTIVIMRAALDNYYINTKHVYDSDSLQRVLSVVWLKLYEKDVFVCSHMSAFLEYWLERNGFNADIVCTQEHCWVIVEVGKEKWLHVEATSNPPQIIPDRVFLYRYKYIYSALLSRQSGYNWWDKVKQGEIIIGRR